MQLNIKRGYYVYSEASYDYPNEFAFTSLKALKEYFHLTASELAIWREEGECPDREELDRIRDCEIVSSVEKRPVYLIQVPLTNLLLRKTAERPPSAVVRNPSGRLRHQPKFETGGGMSA